MKFENRYMTSDCMLSEYIKKVQCKKLRIWSLAFGIIAAIMCVITIIEEDYIITGNLTNKNIIENLVYEMVGKDGL